MNRLRLLFALVAGCCLLQPVTSVADDLSAPFAMQKHYSADVNVVLKSGRSVDSKTYIDGDKMRSDFTAHGMQMEIIVRKDQQKIYQIMAAQKMAMEMPLNPAKLKDPSFGPEGKFDLIGPDTVDGIACMKYKVTPENASHLYFFWIDPTNQAPVQMTDGNGSLTVKWTNFKAGPQDPALFEVPADCTVLQAGAVPGAAPNGQGPGGP